jgi:nucleotide-binding universal stress UspA family protein
MFRVTNRLTEKPGSRATIVQKAKEWPADLIVIASHGRSGVPRSKRLLSGFRDRLSLPPSTLEFVQTGIPGPTRALLGSVAEEVIRNAPCPVLVVRAQT